MMLSTFRNLCRSQNPIRRSSGSSVVASSLEEFDPAKALGKTLCMDSDAVVASFAEES